MIEEKAVFKGSPSAVVNFGTFALCALISIGALAIMIFSRKQLSDSPPLRYGVWALLILPLLFALIKWRLIKSRVYEITTERIKITNGIFSKKTDEMELYRVKDATLVEPFLLRLFSVGDIQVTSADASTPALQLEGISGAHAVREELRKNVEACRDRKRTRITELE
ncbi:MAG: PH domain-containing protein [Verrucomicrobiota bacterium]|nr:PH domain-containing protein [Verrucomicrobiota bacterium]